MNFDDLFGCGCPRNYPWHVHHVEGCRQQGTMGPMESGTFHLPEIRATKEAERIEALEKAIRDALETLKDYNEDGLDIAIRSLVQDLDEALNGITRFRPSS